MFGCGNQACGGFGSWLWIIIIIFIVFFIFCENGRGFC